MRANVQTASRKTPHIPRNVPASFSLVGESGAYSRTSTGSGKCHQRTFELRDHQDKTLPCWVSSAIYLSRITPPSWPLSKISPSKTQVGVGINGSLPRHFKSWPKIRQASWLLHGGTLIIINGWLTWKPACAAGASRINLGSQVV